MHPSPIPDRGSKPLSVDVGLSLRPAVPIPIPLTRSTSPRFLGILRSLPANSNTAANNINTASNNITAPAVPSLPPPSSPFQPLQNGPAARAGWGPARTAPCGFDINLPPSEEDPRGGIADGAQLLLRPSRPPVKRERAEVCEVSSRVSNEEQDEEDGEEEEGEGEGEGEGEEGSVRKKLRLSKEQSALLEDMFKEHSTLNPKQKTALATQLGLKPRQVEVWFQNRRARTKLKQTEVDCELLRQCYGSLREENRRLQKEVQELRALRGAFPCFVTRDYYTSPPAATLTMCPSCEKVAGVNPTKQHRLLLPHQTLQLQPPAPSPLYHQHQLRQSSAA